jgi:hypothetical protein
VRRDDTTRIPGAAALALGASLLAGCARTNPTCAKGKHLFTSSCAPSAIPSRDANTKGTIGPDLDKAFQQSIADGLGRDTVEGVVPSRSLARGGQMPANLVKAMTE